MPDATSSNPPASKKKRPVRRIVVLVVGGLILLVGALISPLPGPGFTIVGPLGLAILATEFAWARRLLQHVEAGTDRVEDRLPWIASPWAAVLLLPLIAGYWVAAYFVVRAHPDHSRATWTIASLMFLPISALATIIILAARRRWMSSPE